MTHTDDMTCDICGKRGVLHGRLQALRWAGRSDQGRATTACPSCRDAILSLGLWEVVADPAQTSHLTVVAA